MDSELLVRIRSRLAAAADPGRAPGMQRYMKSSMPYHGVPSTPLRAIAHEVFAEVTFDDFSAWEREMLGLWSDAQFREEWYCALALAGHRAARPFQTPQALALYERLIVEGAWWDIVDDIATHRVRPILVQYPVALKAAMRGWSTDDNLWKRRTSIICQSGLKQQTDFDLLRDCIEPSISSKEFFLRKAVGWALREYAHSNPGAVVEYVRARADQLSPLSKREALRHQVAAGLIDAIP